MSNTPSDPGLRSIFPPNVPDIPRGWRKLYDDLGLSISMKLRTANDIETPDVITLELAAQAEVLQEVRRDMQQIDGTLPVEDVDQL